MQEELRTRIKLVHCQEEILFLGTEAVTLKKSVL